MIENGFMTPDWVKDAVFYQIFPDRFAKSNKVQKPNNLETWDSPPSVYGYKGGDLLGVAEHLEYLEDLGVNAIYLNPIFQSTANHRYHTHDYFKVDPILGGNQAFRYLLDKAHQKGIRIVLDGVFNHASRGFYQFNHILETAAKSPYTDWFIIDSYPLNAYQGEPNYQCWWNLPALPKFNTDNPQVRSFIYDVARYWVEQGIDGWRLDVPFEIDDDVFWQEFRHIVKAANPDAYLVGEVPWEAQRWCQGDIFDGVMNYQFTQACLGYFAGNNINRDLENGMMGLPSTKVLDAAAFTKRVEELLILYPKESVYAQLNLLDSHDMPRFLSLSSGDQSSLKLATLFQMTYPGAPCIYYGDEIGIDSQEDRAPEFARKSFTWDQSQWDHDLREFIKNCIHIRRNNTALRRGDLINIFAEGSVISYIRQKNQDKLLILINVGKSITQCKIPLNSCFEENTRLIDILGLQNIYIVKENYLELVIPSRTGLILKQE
jgi:neopullulanase